MDTKTTKDLSRAWKVAVIKIGLHILLSMQGEIHEPRRLEHGDSILSSPQIERKDMDNKVIERMFGRIGARVSMTGDVSRRNPAGINVRSDKLGESSTSA